MDKNNLNATVAIVYQGNSKDSVMTPMFGDNVINDVKSIKILGQACNSHIDDVCIKI